MDVCGLEFAQNLPKLFRKKKIIVNYSPIKFTKSNRIHLDNFYISEVKSVPILLKPDSHMRHYSLIEH